MADWVYLRRDNFDGSFPDLIKDDPPGVLTVVTAAFNVQLTKNGNISDTIVRDRGVGVYAPALSHGSLLRRWSGVVESISAAGWCHAELILYGVTDGGEPRTCDARIELGRGLSYGVPYYTMNLSLSAGLTHLFNQLINPAPWSDADLPIRLYIAEVAASAAHLRFQFLWLKNGSSSPQLIADTGEKTTPANWGGSRIGLFIQNANGTVRFSELLTEVYDTVGPAVSNANPADGATNVAGSTHLSFDVTDIGGIDPAVQTITVDGVLAWAVEANQNGFAVVRTAIVGGYHFEITPPSWFSALAHVTWAIHSEDTVGNTSDVSLSFDVAAVVVYTVTPSVLSTAGGQELLLVGEFPPGVPLLAFLGLAGDGTDSPCYGGKGYGYAPVSEDGTTMRLVSPPGMAGPKTLSILYAGHYNPTSVTVVERSWPSKVFGCRGSLPPWMDCGARRLALEGRVR